jgi:hypothetical protein
VEDCVLHFKFLMHLNHTLKFFRNHKNYRLQKSFANMERILILTNYEVK